MFRARERFITSRLPFPPGGDRELCMDADPAGSRDREPASKITKT